MKGRYYAYHKLAERVRDDCATSLEARGIQNVVTFRAKNKDRLEEKLIFREKNRAERDEEFTGYKTDAEIEDDIVDLAGVRIAIHFHKNAVSQFLDDRYKVIKRKRHRGNDVIPQDDYETKFKGYQGDHFVIKLKPPDEAFDDMQIEVQVMSTFHTTWANVEHDILYKQLGGPPRLEERRILDSLNGLVTMGDMYLERLEEIHTARNAPREDEASHFKNDFALGIFLSDWINENEPPGSDIVVKARSIESVHRFLVSVNMNSRGRLNEVLSSLDLFPRFESSLECLYRHGAYKDGSVIIMERIFSKWNSGELRRKSKEKTRPSSLEQCCKVLASTMISLENLFPPTSRWAGELISNGTISDHDRELIRWLVKEVKPRRLIVGDQAILSEQECRALDSLWSLFDNHSSDLVRFVFGVSKLGVLQDFPDDARFLHILDCLLEPFLKRKEWQTDSRSP